MKQLSSCNFCINIILQFSLLGLYIKPLNDKKNRNLKVCEKLNASFHHSVSSWPLGLLASSANCIGIYGLLLVRFWSNWSLCFHDWWSPHIFFLFLRKVIKAWASIVWLFVLFLQVNFTSFFVLLARKFWWLQSFNKLLHRIFYKNWEGINEKMIN